MDHAAVFISYSRVAATLHARILYERLKLEFGPEQVFLDLDGMEIGIDFVAHIEQQLAGCQILLALIDPAWAETRQHRRDRADDFPRIEIATALRRNIRVAPILIEGAVMPDAQVLPDDLKSLARRHGLDLDFRRFDRDVAPLVQMIRRVLARPTAALPSVTTIAPGRPPRPDWAERAGEDAHGRWADFELGGVAQRMRWIPAGRFSMGSPENEPERFPDETPYVVEIASPFWLADTACRQALWTAVMGENPSGFKGGHRPVENVSWQDCARFVEQAERMRPGLALRLPTEAEWEYACRAGTTTAFSFGNTITPEQVNYDGSYPYAGGAKGQYREQTVAVGSLPPNAWGLHEMHGNVWEWVEDDWHDNYEGAPRDGSAWVDTPRAPDRVIRGGSWFDDAGYVRSASRARDDAGLRLHLLGFRLARVQK